jgi:FtsP/CotA-like multicopper oxidase with cupredoxin domain
VRVALLAVILAGLAGCSAPLLGAQVSGWDDDVALPTVANASTVPRTIEIALEAREADVELVAGHPTHAFTYGGTIPGPLIRGTLGDRLVVHFTNHLPEPTTIHWHGLRVDNAMDGVPDVTQPAVPPGGTFDYVLDLRDAGLFWYHPHVDSAAQVGFGLYGAVLVDDPSEPPLGDEVVLVLSDIDLAPDGSLLPADASGELASVFGREGNHILVNGRVRPALRVVAGLPLRLRVVNAAKARYFQLALDRQSFTWIGGDGGRFSGPITTDMPVLAPGQRGDFVVVPSGPSGSAIPLRWVPFDRGYGTTTGREPVTIMDVDVVAQSGRAAVPVSITRDVEALDTSALPTTLTMTMASVGGHTVLGFDGLASTRTIDAALGDTQVWSLRNETDWAHPFHLHGFFFQVVGEAPARWRDTVSVPAHATVRIVTRFDERPGSWMFHCHILDHAELGMMGMLMLR